MDYIEGDSKLFVGTNAPTNIKSAIILTIDIKDLLERDNGFEFDESSSIKKENMDQTGNNFGIDIEELKEDYLDDQ